MSELAFTALAVLVLFAVVVPALTLMCKAALVLRRRFDSDVQAFGSMSSYLLIVGPVLAPAVWFVSAALHESEPGDLTDVSHLAGQACYNALAFAAFVALLLTLVFARRHWQQRSEAARGCDGPSCRRRARRLDTICTRHPLLARLRRRIVVVDRADEALRVVGVFRPVIAIRADLIGQLDDHALTGALLHEAEHLRTYDPLRYLLGSVCLSLNPLARLLSAELRRWTLAREVACDRAAVLSGAEPLSLAQAIVVAARPNRSTRSRSAAAPSASLAGDEVRFVRLRVGLLLAYASAGHLWTRRQAPLLGSAAALLAATVLLPHVVDAWPLNGLHPGIEAVLASLGLG